MELMRLCCPSPSAPFSKRLIWTSHHLARAALQRKRERAAAADAPGGFEGGPMMNPVMMLGGFNPMAMNQMQAMMGQACSCPRMCLSNASGPIWS